MNAQLNYMIARQRCAVLRRAGEQARLAREVPPRRRRLRDMHPITRASTKLRRGTPPLEADPTIWGER
ncbi:MAG TPA: hypothetical protein VMB27_12450 [Solirubrobacteraceae bacterium]|nr:hypothetical protein [Solirubrobacteraceae bacterium]